MSDQNTGQQATGNNGTKEVNNMTESQKAYETFLQASARELSINVTFNTCSSPNVVFARVNIGMVWMQIRIVKRKTDANFSNCFIHYPEEKADKRTYRRAGINQEYKDTVETAIKERFFNWIEENPLPEQTIVAVTDGEDLGDVSVGGSGTPEEISI
jgi:hypothetical protein